jgi:hypothetical protein
MRVRGTAAICVLAIVTAAGCGRFQAASSVRTTTSLEYTGETLPPLVTTTIAGRPGGPTAVAVAPTTTRPPRTRCDPPNTSTIDDPSGFRLILTVAPRQCVKKTDDLTLQLEIQNISKTPLQYDANQDQFFDIIPEGDANRATWTDASCRSRESRPVASPGPLTLEPGERQVRAQATYPGSKNRSDREQCRVLDGLHQAYARLVAADGRIIQSAPVYMTVS